jgi:hypothetical protein
MFSMYHVTHLTAFSYSSCTQPLPYACKQAFPFVAYETKLKSGSEPALLQTIKQCKTSIYKQGHQIYKEHENVISFIISRKAVLEIQWFCNFHTADGTVADIQKPTEVLTVLQTYNNHLLDDQIKYSIKKNNIKHAVYSKIKYKRPSS